MPKVGELETSPVQEVVALASIRGLSGSMGPAKSHQHLSRSPDLLEKPITGHRVDKVQQ